MSGTAAAVMSEASMASPCSLASHAAAAISRSIGCECPTGVQNCLWKTRGPAAGPSRTSRRARGWMQGESESGAEGRDGEDVFA